jgi:hypothetical protein
MADSSEGGTVTRKPDADPDESEPPGGRAAERLRQFERARGLPDPAELPDGPRESRPDVDPQPEADEDTQQKRRDEGDGGDEDEAAPGG